MKPLNTTTYSCGFCGDHLGEHVSLKLVPDCGCPHGKAAPKVQVQSIAHALRLRVAKAQASSPTPAQLNAVILGTDWLPLLRRIMEDSGIKVSDDEDLRLKACKLMNLTVYISTNQPRVLRVGIFA